MSPDPGIKPGPSVRMEVHRRRTSDEALPRGLGQISSGTFTTFPPLPTTLGLTVTPSSGVPVLPLVPLRSRPILTPGLGTLVVDGSLRSSRRRRERELPFSVLTSVRTFGTLIDR